MHVSELSHEHVQTPEEVVSIGQDVKVKIKSIDRDTERISLSIKDTLPTPFENIKGQFHENDVIEGVVVRLANFVHLLKLHQVYKDLYIFLKLHTNTLVRQVKC